MSEVLFSAAWHRVATLRPRLRSHVQMHRHHYRRQLWYVLQDHASQRVHRFTPAAYAVLGLMDGTRTVEALWETASARLGDAAPTQDDLIQLLTQLHVADVLQCDVPPDITELLLRHERQQQQTWQRQLRNPWCIRLPLCDPERYLQRLLPYIRLCFSRVGLGLWLLVVGTAAFLAAMHWHDLTEHVMGRLLLPHNLFLLGLIFPVLKALHEGGHACATKAYGGEVHDMGVLLLVGFPCPYVDVSAAAAFRAKWQRIVVGAAGMMVELFLAALALCVWLNVEPGSVRLLLFDIMLIAGISTLLFNGNPLLRYDGYYMLADYLEIPNLRVRAYAYLRYLWERYAFGCREAVSERLTPSERGWCVGYGLVSWVYRFGVWMAVSLFIAEHSLLAGLLFASGGLIAGGVRPLLRLLTYLTTSPRLRQVRLRAVCVVGGVTCLVVWMVGVAQLPLRSRAEGVIWVPEGARVRATVDGFVERLVVPPGTYVRQGDRLVVCRDPVLESRVAVLEGRVQELAVRYAMERLQDVSQAEILKEEQLLVAENLARAQERLAALTLQSPTDGLFVVPQAEDLPGQFVKRGTQLGYVLAHSTLTARVVVGQDDIALVRQRTHGIEVRLAERLAEPIPAVLWRAVPAATQQLPSLVLGSQGGGAMVTDPRDMQGDKTRTRFFQLDLHLLAWRGAANIGGRVHVRFDHGREALVQRWYRHLRLLFLSRLAV